MSVFIRSSDLHMQQANVCKSVMPFRSAIMEPAKKHIQEITLKKGSSLDFSLQPRWSQASLSLLDASSQMPGRGHYICFSSSCLFLESHLVHLSSSKFPSYFQMMCCHLAGMWHIHLQEGPEDIYIYIFFIIWHSIPLIMIEC